MLELMFGRRVRLLEVTSAQAIIQGNVGPTNTLQVFQVSKSSGWLKLFMNKRVGGECVDFIIDGG
jgi:hypothetical protein